MSSGMKRKAYVLYYRISPILTHIKMFQILHVVLLLLLLRI